MSCEDILCLILNVTRIQMSVLPKLVLVIHFNLHDHYFVGKTDLDRIFHLPNLFFLLSLCRHLTAGVCVNSELWSPAEEKCAPTHPPSLR